MALQLANDGVITLLYRLLANISNFYYVISLSTSIVPQAAVSAISSISHDQNKGTCLKELT